MASTLPRPNDTVPLSEAYLYNLIPDGPASQWVRLSEISEARVRFVGVESNQADAVVRNEQFDDSVSRWELYIGLLTESRSYALITEAGDILDWR